MRQKHLFKYPKKLSTYAKPKTLRWSGASNFARCTLDWRYTSLCYTLLLCPPKLPYYLLLASEPTSSLQYIIIIRSVFDTQADFVTPDVGG